MDRVSIEIFKIEYDTLCHLIRLRNINLNYFLPLFYIRGLMQ